jgi:peptidoglycan/LPS O-acetylase OafA/YrhL
MSDNRLSGADLVRENRLYGADLIRAVACLMVVAHHVAQRVSPEVLGGWAPVSLSVQMFAFGVAAFFVLSGYLLSRPFWQARDAGLPMPNLRTYALRRAVRIVPGFWLALTVSFVLSISVLGTALDWVLVLRFFAGLAFVADFHWLTWFPVEFNAPLWSIGCEVTSYALMPLCLWVLFRGTALRGWAGRLVFVGMIAVVVGLQAVIVQFPPEQAGRGWEFGIVGGAKWWWPNYNPVGFFAVFAVGVLAAGVQVRLSALLAIWFDGLALAGLGLAVWSLAMSYPVADAYGLAGIPYGFPLFPVGVGVFLVAMPSATLLPRLSENRLVAYVAKVSFGVYVWHYLLMEMVRVLWNADYVYWGMRDVGQWAIISVAVVALAFAIATLSYRWVEAPAMRWARRLEGKRAGAPTLSPAAG